MSENLERLPAAFENFLAGKSEWGAELLDPEVEWDASDVVFDLSGIYYGRQAVRQYWRE
jgi:hypothetical protein